MIRACLLFLLMGAGLGAVIYAGVGLALVAVWFRERIGGRCPRCRRRTLELIWWLESYPTSSPAYFECANCHARVSYVPPGPWRDAGDAECEKYYDGSLPASINTRRARASGESESAAVNVRGPAPFAQSAAHAGSASERCVRSLP